MKERREKMDMVSALQQPPGAAPPPQRPSSPASVVQQFSSPGMANSYRLGGLAKIVELFNTHFRFGGRRNPAEIFNLCYALARGIDYGLASNVVPEIVHHLPSIIKQVYQRRNDTSLKAAIMVLLISAKNACKYGWFHSADANEILSMANELYSSFCMTMCITAEVENALDIISSIMPRFYPQLKFCGLIVTFQAKPGFEILTADFQIQRNINSEQMITFVVVQTDNIETSSCIISPPHASFLINGKGVEKRTSASLDVGPQFPTDITKMLKYGTNIIQAIGYFSGTYLIALAFMRKEALSNSSAPENYVQPVVAALDADAEIIEGPSRITVNCPISFRRIKTPAKGHLCKHHQCFDYDNFMEMNSRKPSWRCPCCNQPVSCIDLRIDQNMVKILEEVGEDVADLFISADGSWKAVGEHSGCTDHPHNGTLEGQRNGDMECDSNNFTNSLTDAVDLTMVEDNENDTAILRSDGHDSETKETKPSISDYSSMITLFAARQINHQFQDNSPRISSTSTSNGSLGVIEPNANAAGTLQSLLPDFLINPVITDAVSPALNREPIASLENSQPSFFQYPSQLRQHSENMQLQHSQFGNSIISSGTERPPISRNVHRSPIAIQALPAQTQAASSSQRMRTNSTYQTSHTATAITDGPRAATGDMEIQEVLRTSEISMRQNKDNQDHHEISYSAPQQMVGLPAPNLISTRAPLSQHRGAGAYRASVQSPSNSQDSYRDLSNHRKYPTTQNLPVTFRSSSGFSSAGIGKDSAAQRAAAAARLLAGPINLQPSRTAPSSTATSDSLRLSSSKQLQSTSEVPPEQNWQPTGRMRGSLTGSAFSAALSHYLVPPTQPASSRPPVSSVVASTSEQLSTLVNSIITTGPVTQQSNLRHDVAPPERSSI